MSGFRLPAGGAIDRDRPLAFTFDGDNPRMGELIVGIGFELDPFFEVYQIELYFGGTCTEREIGDDNVEEI